MARVLIIDQENLGLDFALRCAEAGHEVRWNKVPDLRGRVPRDGEGFKGFKIVPTWRDHMPWVGRDGLIVCTGNCRYLDELDRFRDLGFKIFGPTKASADLEIKRSAGMEAMKAVGIEIPPYQCFNTLEDAQTYARKAGRPLVFKPMGDEDDKSLTFVAHDEAEMVGWIGRRIARGVKLRGACMLQDKIDMMCEFGVSGWVGPEGFLPDKWQICFEHKKLMAGDNGPSTGEMGTVTQYVEAEKLAEEALLPMEPILRTLGHRGDFAVGVGIDTKGKAWPFEFTCRLGWPAFYIQVASHRGDVAQWMLDLLDGRDTLKVSQNVAIGVVMAQPNFPTNKSPPELVEGNPISGLDDVWDDVHLVSVMVGRGPIMRDGNVVDAMTHQTTGEYVLVATGLGSTVEAARKDVYKTVDDIHFPNAMYRNDIGSNLEKKLPKLHQFGYALEMEFG
jgi:phosphoribosylamine--glycine ligase